MCGEQTALLDCPFCGGKAIIVRHPGTNWDGKIKHHNVGAMHNCWYVGCPYPFFEDMSPHCEVKPAASWYANLDNAIGDWNRRTITKEGLQTSANKRVTKRRSTGGKKSAS
jgi:hypothetical protein